MLLHEQSAQSRGVVIYTAYNHCFEPHFADARPHFVGRTWRDLIVAGCSTAMEQHDWLRDLRGRSGRRCIRIVGSHLLDTCRFRFGDILDGLKLISANRFENRAPDHAMISLQMVSSHELNLK